MIQHTLTPRRFARHSLATIVAAIAVLVITAMPSHAASRDVELTSGPIAAPIPDGGAMSHVIPAPTGVLASYVQVGVRIDHPIAGDLSVSVATPDGRTIALTNGGIAGGANFGTGAGCDGPMTVFHGGAYDADYDDMPAAPAATEVASLESLDVLSMPLPAGSWTLNVVDTRAGDAGTLLCWKVIVGELVESANAPILGSLLFASTNTSIAKQDGFGDHAPRTFFLTANDEYFFALNWKNWGAPTALATGRSHVFRTIGGAWKLPVQVRARKLGTCTGSATPAYMRIAYRKPLWPGSPMGPWRERNACAISPAQVADLGGARCGKQGRGFTRITDRIVTVGMSCKLAKTLAASSRRRWSYAGCVPRGCSFRIAKHTCRYQRPRRSDADADEPMLYHRWTCKRGSKLTMGWMGYL